MFADQHLTCEQNASYPRPPCAFDRLSNLVRIEFEFSSDTVRYNYGRSDLNDNTKYLEGSARSRTFFFQHQALAQSTDQQFSVVMRLSRDGQEKCTRTY